MTLKELEELYKRSIKAIRREKAMRERVLRGEAQTAGVAEMNRLELDVTAMKDEIKKLLAIQQPALFELPPERRRGGY